MNLQTLKEAFINSLKSIESGSGVPISPATFTAIAAVTAKDGSGFSDIYAKALVFNLFLNALPKNEDLHTRYVKKACPFLMLFDIEDVAEELEKINKFLNHAEELSQLYQSRRSKRTYQTLTSDDDRIQALNPSKDEKTSANNKVSSKKIDKVTFLGVGMNHPFDGIIDEKTCIGSAGMGPCITLSILGLTPENKTALFLIHTSELTPSMFEHGREILLNKYKVNPESLQTYLTGGDPNNFTNFLALYSQQELNITDARILLSNGLYRGVKDAESSSVILMGDQPNNIYYSSKNNKTPQFIQDPLEKKTLAMKSTERLLTDNNEKNGVSSTAELLKIFPPSAQSTKTEVEEVNNKSTNISQENALVKSSVEMHSHEICDTNAKPIFSPRKSSQ